MGHNYHILRAGATRAGKSVATAVDFARSKDAEILIDPHKDSLAKLALIHGSGNLLYCKLSDLQHSIGFDLVTPSTHPDPEMRELENQFEAESLAQILAMAQGTEGMASTSLKEEWVMNSSLLYLNGTCRKPPSIIRFALQPGTPDFDELIRCGLKEDREKFLPLRKLTPRGLRAEVGSAARPMNKVFGSKIFAAWSRGGFPFARFLQDHGKVILERGDETGDETMRVIYGAIIKRAIDIGKRRKKPEPIIRIRIDECVNAFLDFPHVVRATAETAKNGVLIDLLGQNLNHHRGASDELIQNCLRHEWYRCPLYDLARKAAVDVLSGLRLGPDEKRKDKLDELIDDIQNLNPGERWVRDPSGSRREQCEMPESPWPNWPLPDGRTLAEAKLEMKLCQIHQRPEYRRSPIPPSGEAAETASASSSPAATPPSAKPPGIPSAVEALLRRRRQAGTSPENDSAGS